MNTFRGVASQPTRSKPRALDWKGWLPVWATVIGAAVAASAYVSSKADASDVRVIQIELARTRERDAWRDARLCEIAEKVGAHCPPMPSP
jgi:hypothetical protein